MTDPSHRTQVVGDVEQAHSRPLVEMRKKAQYFRLRNNVERTGRLVRNQEGWIVDNCHRDEHALCVHCLQFLGTDGFREPAGSKNDPRGRTGGLPHRRSPPNFSTRRVRHCSLEPR
jgi:hypothetical protein